MDKEEILVAIKEIQCRYSLPAFEANFTDKDYACKQYEKLVIHLAKQQEEKDKEIERLNNIINELEKILSEKIEAVEYMKETLGTSVYKVNPHIDILEKEYNYFSDKIKELKESDK